MIAEWDESFAKSDDRQKAIDAALGGEQMVKMRRELVSGPTCSNRSLRPR